MLGCRCPCCFRIWNLCGNLRSVTHDFELGGAVLADWTVVGGGSRHQLNLVALVDVVLGESPPTDEEACLSTQTALCWSDGVHLGLWNPTHKINLILTGYKRVTKRPILYCDNIVAISVQKEYHVVVSKYWNMLFTLLLSWSYICSVTIYTASIQSLIEVEQKDHACMLIGNSINKIDHYTMYLCPVRFLRNFWNCN